MGKVELKIDWATHEAAKYACEHWHYSGCMPAGKIVKCGVWENQKYIGVILFSMGANKYIGSPYNLKQQEICELTRVALTDHISQTSRIVKISFLFLKKKCPGIRLIVSYADSNKGHHGGIYQAGNWIYTGAIESDAGQMLNGKIVHRRTVYARYGRQDLEWLQSHVDPNAHYVKALPKHKYLMPLDDEIRKQIEPLRKPYPKRDKQATGGDHPYSGGAAPTVTLHK